MSQSKYLRSLYARTAVSLTCQTSSRASRDHACGEGPAHCEKEFDRSCRSRFECVEERLGTYNAEKNKAKELIEAAKPPQKTRNPSSWKPNRGCWKESAACFLPGSRKNLLKIISEAFASCRVICSAED